jgi:hypothetical protein
MLEHHPADLVAPSHSGIECGGSSSYCCALSVRGMCLEMARLPMGLSQTSLFGLLQFTKNKAFKRSLMPNYFLDNKNILSWPAIVPKLNI